MHWINAVAIFIMIGSGWKIYNDDVIFGWLHFPDSIVIGKWAQYGLQWHFFGMWIFVINGLAYLTYGIVTGRFRQKLFPISVREILATVGDALRFRLRHDDLTHYNAVQKILYLGIMAIGILIVISGLALWKPVQFSELAAAVRQLPDHPARAFPVHGGDRRVSCWSTCRWRCWCRRASSPWSPAARSSTTRRHRDAGQPTDRKPTSLTRVNTMSIRTRTPSHLPARASRSIRACSSDTARWSTTSTGATCCAARSVSAR